MNCISPLRREDVVIQKCSNKEAEEIFGRYYWLKRIRRSRRLSYTVLISGEQIAWVQCADPFGTKLTKPLQSFDINEAVELCRGYFVEEAPANIESCAIGKILRILPNDWFSSFHVIKKIVIVYQDIDVGQRGIVYQALGFLPIASCRRARHYSKPTRGNSNGNKIIWARALRPVSGNHYQISMPTNVEFNGSVHFIETKDAVP
jgi:hypothetical protein